MTDKALQNMMEYLVAKEVDRQCADLSQEFVNRVDRADLATSVLNKLPPLYLKSDGYTEEAWQDQQRKAEIQHGRHIEALVKKTIKDACEEVEGAIVTNRRLNHLFRRYHRQLALIMALPLLLTTLTGLAIPILDNWLALHKLAGWMIKLHSGRLFKLESIYPILNGVGLMGLLITGLWLTRLFQTRSSQRKAPSPNL